MKSILNVLLAWGPFGVLILALVDSAGVPIPVGVDALVVYLSGNNPGRAWLAALMGVAGSTAGNLILYFVARKGGELYLHKHTLSGSGKRFRNWFHHYGLLTVFVPGVLPVPLPMKIFVLSAGATQVSAAAFTTVVLAARIIRYGALAYLGVRMGEAPLIYMRQHMLLLMGIAVALFALLFLLVRYLERAHPTILPVEGE